ncbi:MAG TPA: MauE/DoxX family redox-associated membrane protein [Steroidobacteraceae bacterium]|nr:MauE/DoxX family redox-associated membrane protein [Steroidobacteraceae bacterium]
MGDASMAAAVQMLVAQLAVFQALLLTASAVHKALRWSHSTGVVYEFIGVPRSMAASVLAAVMTGELLAGTLLIVPEYRAMGAMLAASIWALYLAFIVRAIFQDKRDIDCGCSFGRTSRPLGTSQVARNAVLAGLAVFIAGVSAIGGSVPARGSQVLGGIALLALYGALDQVMALQPLRRGEIS